MLCLFIPFNFLKQNKWLGHQSFVSNFSLSFDYLSNYPQVLLSLGFGGSESLSKIPERFLSHRSKAKGVTITNFVKKEEDLMNR